MKRVVITGLGVTSSIGQNINDFWTACKDGVSGITEIKKNNLQVAGPKFGGQIHDFDPSKYIFVNNVAEIGRGSQLLISSMRQAIEDSKLKEQQYEYADFYIGTTMGEVTVEISDFNIYQGKISSDILLEQNQLKNMLVYASKEFNLKGQSSLITNACAAGNYANIQAFEQIRRNKTKVAIAAGTDPFSTVAYYGFNRLKAISPDKCRPFDKNRKGMLVAEGSACVILEELEHALARGAKIYAEIVGYGVSSDSFHITSPHPESLGIIRSTRNALNYAKITPEDIDYISAHGTGTPANDRVESHAINSIFGNKKPTSSIKSMLGHTMGAASSIESVVSCLAIGENIAPPTINFETPDEECEIDCIPNKAREFNMDYVINNSYAFGGTNASVVFKKFKK
ncbi:3-oxoacyl-ACP synthase [Lysinibacillus sp. KCTC 33748]|uniref:beta-ketoacyl-[acyl-carrier-protein] synthase family protein n=1 Tax=unclassified Lysinibacillus TaxID=2636778 RepID=UPI0009A62CC3|nr:MULTISPECIES: beta-ketoacyl-[acyl-carrier-protein] synthase family protein [unclassified Lysinibacillus]OXS72688.1 3-oxoacyl-ACP synthase [Lysinibacillus sp. KCTC 33748]SKB92663.1 3-oxoacyl-[acyl-carrier-protein] synthase II [Lysinibacillus sp. AC-3]